MHPPTLILAFATLALAGGGLKKRVSLAPLATSHKNLQLKPVSTLSTRSPFLSDNISANLTTRTTTRLSKRQTATCDAGEVECGSIYCMDAGDTCCPGGEGSCELGTYCDLGTDGVYGCCEIGETCTGAGGGGTCDEGEVECGALYCMDADATCCPGGEGSCDAGTYCDLGDDGVYGCCDDGETCTGDGDPGPSGSGGTCGIGQTPCGDGCLDIPSTCCPDGQGGCDIGETCTVSNSGIPGCCPFLSTCEGEIDDDDSGSSGSGFTTTSERTTTSRTTSRRTSTSTASNFRTTSDSDSFDTSPTSGSDENENNRPTATPDDNPADSASSGGDDIPQDGAGNPNVVAKSYVTIMGAFLGATLGAVLML